MSAPKLSVRQLAMKKREEALAAQKKHDELVKDFDPKGPPKGTVRHVFLMQGTLTAICSL